MTDRKRPRPDLAGRERSVHAGEGESPYAIVHRLLRTAHRERVEAVGRTRDKARRATERQRLRYADLALETATTLHELRGLLARYGQELEETAGGEVAQVLRALDRRLGKVLESTGTRMLDPVGEPYSGVADLTDVKGRPADTADDDLVVAHTLRPAVVDGADLLRRAEVMLELGPGPDGQAEEEPSNSPEGSAEEPSSSPDDQAGEEPPSGPDGSAEEEPPSGPDGPVGQEPPADPTDDQPTHTPEQP